MSYVCANCGQTIKKDECYICQDNFLQSRFFDSNRENRFCSQECFCEAMMLDIVPDNELPLDAEESRIDEDDEYEGED